jgi:hypothetical protein
MKGYVYGPIWTKEKKLSDISPLYWANTILWELVEAVDPDPGKHSYREIDPDELLDQVLEIIWKYKELEK